MRCGLQQETSEKHGEDALRTRRGQRLSVAEHGVEHAERRVVLPRHQIASGDGSIPWGVGESMRYIRTLSEGVPL